MKNKKLKELLKEYAITPEDTIINLQIAYEYFKLEQTASALTFFQRAAELSTDDNLAYECLIYIAKCLVKQGRRLYNAKNSILQAEALMPNRPEAFFEESLIEEQNSNWQEVYTSAIVAKNNWNNAQTYTSGEFYEKYQIDFQIALSLYNINRHEDSKAMFLSIKSDYIMNDYYADLVDINIKNLWPDEVKELHKTSDMDDTKIPVIGTAVVNGTKWLKRLIESVDYPVENFFIINNNGRGELDTDLEQIKNIKNEFIDNIFITNFPSNVGVPGAWNLIIKCYMNAPYWIIANDDTSFGPGFLEEMVGEVKKDSEVGMVHGDPGDCGSGAWDLFLIRDFVVQKIGLFDENFYPAYCEDYDYVMRMKSDDIKIIDSLDGTYYHGPTDKPDYNKHARQTLKTDPSLADGLWESKQKNIEYLNEKWGKEWRDCKPYKLAFNKYAPSWTTYDLNFVRDKHLGF